MGYKSSKNSVHKLLLQVLPLLLLLQLRATEHEPTTTLQLSKMSCKAEQRPYICADTHPAYQGLGHSSHHTTARSYPRAMALQNSDQRNTVVLGTVEMKSKEEYTSE